MLLQRFLKLACIMGALIGCGTLGFCLIERWPMDDALYMTVITISTVGFGEMRELSPYGRAFTSCLILVSITCMACWTAGITSVIVEGDLTGSFRKRRMQRMAKRNKDHVIVCGSGMFARAILESLYLSRHSIVVLCNDPVNSELIRTKFPAVPIIEESPTDELALARANLATSSFVVAATDSDVDNFLISMTCKDFNPNLVVYAFSIDGDFSGRMAKLGVDEVISPYRLGSSRVVELIEKNEQSKPKDPLLAEFLVG